MSEIEKYNELQRSIVRQMRGNWLNPRSTAGKRTLVLFFIAAYLLILTIEIECSLHLRIFPSFILFLGILALGGFVLCSRAIFNLLQRLRIYFALIGIACFLAFFTGGRIMWQQSKVSRHRAEIVIDGLSRYYTDHGTYPESLRDLVPDYLPSVPRSSMGFIPRKFRYSYYDPLPVYRLSFPFHGKSYDYHYFSFRQYWFTKYPETSW